MSTQQMSRLPATLKQQLAGDYFKQQVALSLPKHMTPDRFVRVALTALLKTPKLAECTPESVIQCMLNCSALGLEPDGRRAHLIPYGNTCTLIIDYKGIVELAKRSGDVSSVFAQVVCDADAFEWQNGEVKHQIDWKRDRGSMYAAYATITFKDGSRQTDVMTKAEIDAIRKRSKAGNAGPWVTDYNEMAKKTVFRRASKWITLSPEIVDALEKEDAPFSSATLVTDLAPQPTAHVEEAKVVESPVLEDAGDLAPQTATKSLQDELAECVIAAGFTYDDFAKWGVGSGNCENANELGGFSEVPDAICKRLLRSKAGMLKGIALGKEA